MDEINACKYNASNELYFVGASASTNMTPFGAVGTYTQNFNASQLSASTPLSSDAIIGKFDNTQTLTWFTFYGTDALGTNANSYAADYFYGMTLVGTDLYACGKSGGTNLPHSYNTKKVNGNFDGILVHFYTSGKINTNDALYTDGNIVNYAVKTSGTGTLTQIYTVGQANSIMTPTNSGLYYYSATASGTTDACFGIHSPNLSTTIHNSFLGGSSDDAAYDIQFSNSGQLLIAGGTNSSDFPTHSIGTLYTHTANPISGFYSYDNFITCVEKNNINLKWSTYLGSERVESSLFPVGMDFPVLKSITTIAVDGSNHLYVLGTSNSYTTFPLNPWNGYPTYYQPQSSTGSSTVAVNVSNDGTVTRMDLALMGVSVGLEEFKNTEIYFGLYPNPTSTSISITNSTLVNDNLHYMIFDMNGKKLKDGNLRSTDTKDIDVSFLEEGIYVINVTNGVKTFSNKFVKVNH